MDEIYTWTVDVETDWGGRATTVLGLEEGLPIILETFRANNVKALFFVSSELMKSSSQHIDLIIEKGHEIGSHGHFHIGFKDKWRALQDKEISMALLSKYSPNFYRAPRFSYDDGSVYATPGRHIGLLKSVWFGVPRIDNPIFYLHPFDLVKGFNAPNPFIKLWYSKYDTARLLFIKLVESNLGNRRLQ